MDRQIFKKEIGLRGTKKLQKLNKITNYAKRGEMPKKTEIKSTLVIGSGPIVIGQAAE